MVVRKTKKSPKPRSATGVSDARFVEEVERAHWPAIKRKIDKSLKSLDEGKGRKWDLDRFLADAEKRRRSKLAAE
jgi:hypothetical protein